MNAGDEGDDQQLDDQRAPAAVEDVGPEAQALGVRQLVRAILVQTALRLLGGQPSKGRVERVDRLLNGDRAEIDQAALIPVWVWDGFRSADPVADSLKFA